MSQITDSVLMMSTWYIFMLLNVVQDVHTGSNIIQDAVNVIQLQQTEKQLCDLSKLPAGYQIINCTDHLSPCDMMCNIESTNISMDVCCVDGIWDIPNSGTVALQMRHMRHKRFWIPAIAAVVAVGLFVCLVLCGQSSSGGNRNPDPPAFDKKTCPPPDINTMYTTEINQKTRQIYWDKPIAKDASGNVISDVQIASGMETGSKFPEGHHYITYVAKDKNGYQTFCSFKFEVVVIRCKPAIWPEHGYIKYNSLDPDPIYGTSCSFKCDEGFELSGDSVITCLLNGEWTGGKSQSCLTIKCPKPANPENGEYTCLSTGNDLRYQAICWAECYVGYELEKLSFSQCAADKTWFTNREPRCLDREPPKIKCRAYQHFHADSSNVKKNASWILPEAEDNIDGTNVTIIQDDGPAIGSDLTIGFNEVQYHAEDSQGNKSPKCTSVLYVEEITCSHPSLQITDENMKFSCRRFNLGDNCTLSCHLNLPLRGDKEITCSADSSTSKGKWTWSSATEPYCYVVTCPSLNAPSNGAMTCDSINLRPFCAMFCNKNFDLPYKFDGRFFCLDSDIWSPTYVVPDCTAPRRPGTINLPSELHYYSGSCDNESTLFEIKEMFIQIVSEIPTNTTCIGCTVETVTVKCGVHSKRKRRVVERDILERTLHLSRRRLLDTSATIRLKRQVNNTHETVIYFAIVVPWNQGNMTLSDAYTQHDNITFTFRNVLKDFVNAGKFNLSGYSGPDFQYESYGTLQCENGFLDNDVCKTCSIGMQYNETTKSCKQCPLNTYQDEERISSCKQCPSGHVTVDSGRKHINECIELCPAGSFSPTTAVPCTLCPIGNYQSSIGQKACVSCPDGTTTNTSGSASEASCSYYNIYIDSEISSLEISRLSSNTENLTLGLWFQVSSKGTGSHDFSISSSHPDYGRYFSVAIQETISVYFGHVVHNSTETVIQGEWIQLIVTLDSSSQLLTIRLKNEIALQESFLPVFNDSILTSGSSLKMDIGSNTIIRFTRLFMANAILSNDILTSLPMSCTYKTPTSFLVMSNILDMQRPDIQVEIPSECIAVDECSSNPCGTHTCINSVSGFECRCLNGHSGPACDTPPDLCQISECKNGATCINHGTGYICQCQLGYLGNFCENAPVDGNWAEWSAWSICSASCGGGSRARSRQCASPAPGQYGLDCISHDTETETCNMERCPKCPELPLGFGTKDNVTIIDGTEIHIISCQDGLSFAPGFEPTQEYKCGISTHYRWTHTSNANPLGRLPSCAEVIRPKMLATTTTIPYDSLPCSALSVAKATVEDKLTSLQCVSNKTCNVSVSTTCSSNERVIAIVTLTASLSGKETLELQAFYNNQKVSDSLHDLVITVLELEASTQRLMNKTVYELDVENGGQTYHANTRSIDVVAVVTCPVGFVGANGVCVECPVGTYYKTSTSGCQYCDIGTYQDKTAQITCELCAIGYITIGLGSVNTQDCIVNPSTQESLSTSSVVSGFEPTPNSRPYPSSDVSQQNSQDLAVIIGCSIAGLAVVIISSASGISVYKWKTSNRTKGSFLSIRRAVSPEPEVSKGYEFSEYINLKNQRFLPNGHLTPIILKAPLNHTLPPLRQETSVNFVTVL